MSNNLSQLQKGNLTPAVSYVKITVIVLIIVTLASAAIVGFFLLRVSEDTKEEKTEVEIASSYIPENYFRRPVKKETVTTEPVTKVVVMSTPSERAEEPPVTEVIEPTPTVVAPKLTAEEMFVKEQFDALKAMQDQRRALLISRRGKPADDWQEVVTMQTIEAQEQAKKPLESPTDKDFSAHDIKKDESTFPVDLSRVVTADRSIPCVLREQINSMLEGRTTCFVERNVFGFHGRNILIPAGSVLMGKHGSLKKVGDERFNINWTRMIRPDGVHVSLTDSYTADRIGSTGIEGLVNNRTFEKYGGAILTSSISAIAQASIANEGNNNTRIAIESYGTDLGRVTAAMLQENINIKPYSIVPAGTRINVNPTTDIWLKSSEQGAMFVPVEQ